MRPAWKSYPEFRTLFIDLPKSALKDGGTFYNLAPKKIESILAKYKLGKENYLFKAVKTKTQVINDNEMFILINDEPICYTKLGLIDGALDEKIITFAYLYLSEKAFGFKKEIIDNLKTIRS